MQKFFHVQLQVLTWYILSFPKKASPLMAGWMKVKRKPPVVGRGLVCFGNGACALLANSMLLLCSWIFKCIHSSKLTEKRTKGP